MTFMFLSPAVDDEDRAPAHAVQRLADGLAVLAHEGGHVRHVAGDERGRARLGEPGGVDLLVHVPQALGAIADQHPFDLGPLEHVGGVDVLHVEWRVLPHQDDVHQRP